MENSLEIGLVQINTEENDFDKSFSSVENEEEKGDVRE